MTTETVRVRGLAKIPAGMFGAWGALVLAKGLWDVVGPGQPEANLYAPKPWAFVTQEQWLRYGLFEAVYGLACLGVAWLILRYARYLPETAVRPREEQAKLFR